MKIVYFSCFQKSENSYLKQLSTLFTFSVLKTVISKIIFKNNFLKYTFQINFCFFKIKPNRFLILEWIYYYYYLIFNKYYYLRR